MIVLGPSYELGGGDVPAEGVLGLDGLPAEPELELDGLGVEVTVLVGLVAWAVHGQGEGLGSLGREVLYVKTR